MAVNWWEWQRSHDTLEAWVRSLIGERPFLVSFKPGAGSYVDFRARELVVDPVFADQLGGEAVLPYRWRGHEVRSLQQLQWNTARALARHEAAHILYTDAVPTRGGTHHWLVNALEDGRIERAMGATMPWAWADFVALGRMIWRQFDLGATRERRLLQACLLHRWDILRPRRTPSRIILTDPTEQATWEQIRPLVEQSWYVGTTGEVAEIALAILRLIGIPEQLVLIVGLVSIDGGIRGERPGDDPPIVVLVPGENGEDTSSDAAADAGDDSSSSPDKDESADDTAPTSFVLIDMEQLDEQSERDRDTEAAAQPPSADIDPSGGELFMHPYRELERSIIGDARRLVQVLTPPTPNVAPRPSAVQGQFQVRQYVRSQGDKPLLHDRDVAPSPKGLALVTLIDRTGSMLNSDFDGRGNPLHGFYDPAAGRMVHARKAVLLLERTCALRGIPHCIGYAGNDIRPEHGYRYGRPYRRHTPVVWIKDWHTPTHAEGPRALIAGMYGDANEEAVSASLRLAQQKLEARREPTKLILYIHDGDPTDENAEEVATTVKAVRTRGILVLGLFVGNQSQIRDLQAIFGAEFTIGLDSITKLTDRVSTILRRYAGW